MKVFKYIFILCLLITIALCVFIATKSSTVSFTKTVTIAAKESVITDLVKDIEKWQYWNSTIATVKYNETLKTASWSESHIDFEVKENTKIKDSISQEILMNQSVFTTTWEIKPDVSNSENVQVSLSAKKELTFKEKFNQLFSKSFGSEIENYISNRLVLLQNYVTNDLETYSFKFDGVVKKQAENFIQYKDTCSVAEFDTRLIKIKAKLAAFVKEFGIVSVGKPFVMYQPVMPKGNTIAFTYCLPVEEEIISTSGSEIEGGYHDEFMAFKSTLIGNPNKRYESWEKTADSLVNTQLVKTPANFYIEIIDLESKAPNNKKTEFYIPLYFPKKVVPKVITPVVKKPFADTIK